MQTTDLVIYAFNYAQRDSWVRLNMDMNALLVSVVKLGLAFDEDDMEKIFKQCRGGYWFGQSANGHHHGEGIYSAACQWNPSAAKSYEKLFARVPFLLGSTQMHVGCSFIYNGLRYSVTGWSKDNKQLTAVAYKEQTYDSATSQWIRKGKKLFSMTREQWLAVRKDISEA